MKINSGTFLSYLQLKESNDFGGVLNEAPRNYSLIEKKRKIPKHKTDNKTDNKNKSDFENKQTNNDIVSDNTAQAVKSKCLVISKDYGFIPNSNAIVYNGNSKQNTISDIISTVIKLKDSRKDELFSSDKLSGYDKNEIKNIETFKDASSCVANGELLFKLAIVNSEILENTILPTSANQVPVFNITIDDKSGITNIGYNLPEYINGNIELINIKQTSGNTDNSFKEIIGDNLVIDSCNDINLSIWSALANNNCRLANIKIIKTNLADGKLLGFDKLSITTLDLEDTNITTLEGAPTKFEKSSGQQSARSDQLKGKATGVRIQNNSSLNTFGKWKPTNLDFLQISANNSLDKSDITKFEQAVKATNTNIRIEHDAIIDTGNEYIVNVSLTPEDFIGRITNNEVSKPLKMGEGAHNIDCSGLDLKSFKNFPTKINGDLIAKNLKGIKTLEYFPTEVTGDVDLSGTDLNQNAFNSIPNKNPETITIKGHLYLKDVKNLKHEEKQTGEININTSIIKVDPYKVVGINVAKEPPFKLTGTDEKDKKLIPTGAPITPEGLAFYIDKDSNTIKYPIE
jgi:hypothetical protein